MSDQPPPNPSPAQQPAPAPASPQMIGNYPIEKELGRGGMGVVYLARDPRLNRPVAIKVLPSAFVSDPLRLQRFEREARTLASLNHRNVAMIFGLEDADGQRLLVLEFVPGQTLTQKLGRGPLQLDDCLRTCMQIAEGLEAAHERDVIHRDLKPDNVKVTPDGLVKILDFGLATTTQANQEAQQTGSALTMAGMVMGTPGYMSPEQARGQPTDKRADIWAFGCVLFECLSGYKAFGGETVSDCIAAILEREPDFGLLPTRTPNRLRELLRRCFVKDSRRRMRDIGDVRIELEDVLTQPQSGWYQAAGGSGPARAAATARLFMPLGNGQGGGGTTAPGSTNLPEVVLVNSPRGSLAVAPDGSAVALIAGRPPQTQLWVRRMDSTEARPIPGTLGADAPFFSADGAKIGFFADGKLKRVSLSGGAPVPLAAAPRHQGGCWDASDIIYFVPDWQKPLMKIPGGGGVIETVVQADMAAGELGLLTPEILPGSRHALLSVWTGNGYDEALITAIDLRSGTRKPLIHGGCNPKYLPSGHIIFTRAGSLFAVAFDPEKLEVFGSPLAVEEKIMGNALGGSAQFAAGADGTLLFAPGAMWEPRCSLLASGKGGEPTSLIQEQKAFFAPRVSPNGRLMCVQVQGATDHLWLYDLDRPGSAGTRLTFHADNGFPAWSTDGSKLAFRSNMSGRYEIYQMGVDLSRGGSGGTLDPIYASDRSPTPCCYADEGRTLVFTQTKAAPATGMEVWAVELDKPDSVRIVATSPTSAWGATVSPDGKYIAYVSDETGRPEVYVQAFPGPGARRQVSSEGGAAPVWARAGGELFFRAGDAITAVRIAVEPSFMVGRPRTLFQGSAMSASQNAANYDVLADGQFVLLRTQEDQARATSLNVVLNWFTELKRRVPVPLTSNAGGSRHTLMGHQGHTPGGGMQSSMPTRSGGPSMPTPHTGAPHHPIPPKQAFPSDMKTMG